MLARYEQRFARALASIINVLDPDVIVLGGGLSNIDRLYANVPAIWSPFVFSDRVDTRLVSAAHGDASGVRGAAWLWERRDAGSWIQSSEHEDFALHFLFLAAVWTVTRAAAGARRAGGGPGRRGERRCGTAFTPRTRPSAASWPTRTSAPSCHGADLAGDGFAPALAGAEFSGNWNELSVGDFFERIRISMPPTGPNTVTNAQKADIVAHIFNFNKYPAGTTELEPKTEVLKTIKIEMKK